MSKPQANVRQYVIVGFGLMPPNLSNITIIVVEDDNDVRVGAFLDLSGANVVSARNGREGLEATKTNMVLSDIKMPEMDGFGLMREIRTLGPAAGGSVPVVAMTESNRLETRMHEPLIRHHHYSAAVRSQIKFTPMSLTISI